MCMNTPYTPPLYSHKLTINIEKQFILIEEDPFRKISLIGQYTTNEDAMRGMKSTLLKITREHMLSYGYYDYAILDLEQTIPVFLNGPMKKLHTESPKSVGRFYSVSEIANLNT